MRKYEHRETTAADRTLIDLRDQRDHLSIQLSLLDDGDVIDPGVRATMKRNLWLLDDRITKHRTPIGV
ncbi:MAG TPA: hypothetical protein VKC17_06660 [Sphingomicrobium sp.]|nr:hypothetical protein [Sphingomicrobium sp.]